MHRVARPLFEPLRFISKSSVFRMRAPDAPMGWPMAIAAEAMLNGKFKHTGVEVPLHREYYDVILPELERMGVHFEETHKKC